MQKGRLSWNIPRINVLLFTLGHFGTDWAQRRHSSPSPLFYRGLPSFLSGSSGHHLCKYCPRLCNAASHRLLFGPCIPSLFGPPWCLSLWVQSFSHGLLPRIIWFILFFSHAERIGQQPFPSRSSSSCKRHFRRPKKARRWGLFLSVAMRALPSVPWQQGSVPISLASRVSSFTPWSISLRLSS